MKKRVFLLSFAVCTTVLVFQSCVTKTELPSVDLKLNISKTELQNKIKGGWAGQVIDTRLPAHPVGYWKLQLVV